MMSRFLVLSLICLGLQGGIVIDAHAAPERLVADLSQKTVAITSSYPGTELLLFGALEGEDGDDIVLLVSGPEIRMAHHRSDKVAGIWVKVETNIWENAPSFYHIFSNRALSSIAAPAVLQDAQIGAEVLALNYTPQEASTGNGHANTASAQTTAPSSPATATMIKDFSRNMQDLGLWAEMASGVTVQRNTLFRATLALPKNVPPGNYTVRVVHFRGGAVVSQQTTDMTIQRAGFSAMVYNFAHQYSALYGLFAIAFAICAGWLAAAAFRRK